jgi:subtilisin family serine protease
MLRRIIGITGISLWAGLIVFAAVTGFTGKANSKEAEGMMEETSRLNINAKIARLDIETATLDRVIQLFGEPTKYIWGDKTFEKSDLPDNYILVYADGFNIYMRNSRIVELRHEGPDGYFWHGKLQFGSSIEEVIKTLGRPKKTVAGQPQPNAFEDGVLYKDIDGRKGHCYYSNKGKGVRFFFQDYKVTNLYVSRNDLSGRRPAKERPADAPGLKKAAAFGWKTTKEAGPVELKGDKIVSRVLPYPDFTSLFIRLPIAHAIATGQGVKVAIVQLSGGNEASAIIKKTAPGAEIRTYTLQAGRNSESETAQQISKYGCKVAVIPDVHLWPGRAAIQLTSQLIKNKLIVVVPSDLSEEYEKIKTVNTLQTMGALTVGRVNRQSLVMMEDDGEAQKPFNRQIRRIQTDVFSTVGIEPESSPTNPAATAAGVAALVLERRPELTGEEVRGKIIDGARKVWQETAIESNIRNSAGIIIDDITTRFTPTDERLIFRFKALDAAGSLEVDTEIPWFLNMLNCAKAWEITKGQGVVVVVSDQGFHIKHPALIKSIKSTMQFGPLAIESPGQNFHGTDMSRILLSVAPEAKIIPVLCSGDKEKLAQNIAKSFLFAAEQKADVITGSWAGWFNKNEEILSAVRKAADSGVTVSWFHYPEPYPGVLRPTLTYSSWQQELSIGFADRFLTDEPGFHPVEIEAGLSGTAPQAAGIASLVKSVNPELTPTEVEKLIFENSTDIGKGVLIPDAYKIVLAARGRIRAEEDKTTETIAKDLVSSLVSGDYKKAVENFDGTMKNALPAEKLQQVWNSIIAQSGPFVEQLGTRREKILQYDVIFVTCKFENAALDAKVVFDRNKQIAGFFFVPS